MCKECIYPCATCSNLTYCYTCGYDTANRYPAPFCECRDELTDYNESCITCTTPCATCTGPSDGEC